MPVDQPVDQSVDHVVAEPATLAKLLGALRRYQVLAYVVGVMLLALVAAMGFKYLGGEPRGVEIIGPIHGFVYAVYLGLALDLAIRARWSIRGTLLVLIAGTIPFLSFVAERIVTRRVRAGQSL